MTKLQALAERIEVAIQFDTLSIPVKDDAQTHKVFVKLNHRGTWVLSSEHGVGTGTTLDEAIVDYLKETGNLH